MNQRPKVLISSLIILLCFGLISSSFSASADLSSLDHVLPKVTRYDYGKSREPLTELSDIIRDAAGSPDELKLIEQRLLKALESGPTKAAKQFICRKLSIIGTEESVPTLAAMLTSPDTSDMARYALERIPGSAVDKALRRALNRTRGNVKIGIINSLGQRGNRRALGSLTKLITYGDKEIAVAAISAVGKIGGGKAVMMLERARTEVKPELRVVWADAYLMCADKALAEGNTRRALQVYRKLYVPAESVPVRIAALRGIVAITPQKGAAHVVDILRSEDRKMQSMVVGLLQEIPGTEVTKAIAAELPSLSISGQIQLLSALANRSDRSALPAVLNAVKSPEADVRVAALGAVGSIGDASTVDLLAKTAATAAGPEAEAARLSLYRLGAPDTDQKILTSIPQADSKVKVELIRSVGERNIAAGVSTLLRAALDPQRKVRLESLKVLRIIAQPKDVPALIDLLLNMQTEAERKEAERCVAAVARKLDKENQRAEAVLSALTTVTDIQGRRSLLSVLGKIGDDSALPVLHAALKDKDTRVQDAAVRALADWPDAAPAAALIELARSAPEKIHRVLALRGYIRMVSLPSDRSAEQTLEMYKAAMEAAARPEEKRLVLAGIPAVQTVNALKFVEPYLEDETVKAEAEIAYMAIAVAIKPEHEQEAKAALDKMRMVSDGGPAVVTPGKQTLLKPLQAVLTPPMELTSDQDGVLFIVVPTEDQRLEEPGTGGRAIYSFSTSQKGVLHLDFFIDCADNNNDSWHIKLDDHPYVKWNDNITKGWQWKEFAQEYTVEKGKHILIIDQREDGAKIGEIGLKLKESSSSQ
ncbi:MAG: HEAT repeat domain-containing protein [Planctomycetota bacterium]|jgi:HEAT repeat protein